MLTQLNEQRDKLQKMLASLGDEAVDPAMPIWPSSCC